MSAFLSARLGRLLVLAILSTPALALGNRTPINALPFDTTGSGEYYLTQSLSVVNDYGINVVHDDVVIDLCGFSIEGTPGTATGIRHDMLGLRNCTVKNGAIVGFARSVSLGSATKLRDLNVRMSSDDSVKVGSWSVVERVSVESSGANGLDLGFSTVARDCFVISSDIGVLASVDCHLENISTRGGDYGFDVGSGTGLRGCTAAVFFEVGFHMDRRANADSCSATPKQPSISAVGFLLKEGARVRDCSVDGATVGVRAERSNLVADTVVVDCETGVFAGRGSRLTNLIVDGSDLVGIHAPENTVTVSCSTVTGAGADAVVVAGVGSRVTGCQVYDNTGNGIVLDSRSLASSNVVMENGGIGIQCLGDSNRLSDNTLSGNGAGIATAGVHDLLVGNRSTNNVGPDYALAPKSIAGPLLGTSGWIQGAYPQANFTTPLF